MTLQQFCVPMADMNDRHLRRAMTIALAAEIPRTPEGYQRFYARVVDQLDRTRGTDMDPVASNLEPLHRTPRND